MVDHPTRKLAVLLHADVVGSTTLVRIDEALAHERMRSAFQRLDAVVTAHGGLTREIRGDALIAEFSRASDAVTAATAFQEVNETSNETLEDDVRPVLRIGVAMGEVIVTDNTVTGEGIVLAQRLEQLAKPGGICVQGAVYETMPKRLPFAYENLGEKAIKGFSEPVRVFAVRAQGDTASAAVVAGGTDSGESLPEKPSIAVLPFTNMSDDPGQDYFSDGLTEDIITELSHHRDLFVTARNSSFAFRGESPDIVAVGKKLNVRYVLEGSIRKAGSRVRVTAQLCDAATGGHVWAERYDRDVEDIFAVQDEVVRIITATLIGRVERAGYEATRRKPPSSFKAYDCVVHGLSYFYKWTPEDNERARSLFEQAIRTDPEYASAHAWLAEAHFREGLNAWSASHQESFAVLFEHASRAVALDDNDSRAQTSLGLAYLFRGEHELASYHLERALTLNPSDTRALVHLARCQALAGEPRKAVESLREASRFNPMANFNWYAGQVLYIAREHAAALEALTSLSNPNVLVHAFTAATHAQLGNDEEAHRSAGRFVPMADALVEASGAPKPASWVEFVTARYPFRRDEDSEHLAKGLRLAGLR